MNWTLIAITLFAFFCSMTISAQEPPSQTHRIYATGACSSSETWALTPSISESYQEKFKASLRGNLAPVRGFSEALAMRRFAKNAENRFLGAYWISRALYDAKLLHIALNGFISLASRPLQGETAGIQIAALECINQIHSKFPATPIPLSLISNLEGFEKQLPHPLLHETLWRAALYAMENYLGENRIEDSLLARLKGSGPYEDFALALKAARLNNHNEAVPRLDHFLNGSSTPMYLKRYINTAHILMAHELYVFQQFDRAGMHLRMVAKSSNELATALEELAWTQLMNDRPTEAIGTAMNLQAGGLRHTFTPEAPMVMAMALNEICQYPESVRAIRSFKKHYEKPYAWLTSHSLDDLYPTAIQYVRHAPDFTAPDRVASEWVRSPLFISSQDELNLLFDEQEATLALGRSGALEQAKIADVLLVKSRDIAVRIHGAHAKAKERAPLPPALIDELIALKEQILVYRRMQQAAPVWHTILANYKQTAKGIKKQLISTINADLKTRSQRMLTKIDEIAENIQLIEVEIYNGASQDIIWQNAHPDYKKLAQKLREDRYEGGAHTWDWGRSPAGIDEEGGEVWEDELGSFAANLYDNCSSKDRYLALKSGRK
ncbi:hypothetical protein WDW37_16735 [Bdellovibrionota bacterium FG-1]